jgi:hypothetical protein
LFWPYGYDNTEANCWNHTRRVPARRCECWMEPGGPGKGALAL